MVKALNDEDDVVISHRQVPRFSMDVTDVEAQPLAARNGRSWDKVRSLAATTWSAVSVSQDSLSPFRHGPGRGGVPDRACPARCD